MSYQYEYQSPIDRSFTTIIHHQGSDYNFSSIYQLYDTNRRKRNGSYGVNFIFIDKACNTFLQDIRPILRLMTDDKILQEKYSRNLHFYNQDIIQNCISYEVSWWMMSNNDTKIVIDWLNAEYQTNITYYKGVGR